MTENVDLTINDLTATYTPGEQQVMRGLVRSGAADAKAASLLIHEMKALFDARILDENGYPL